MSRSFMTALTVAATLTHAASVRAQTSTPKTPGFELLVPSGTVIPTGAQEENIQRGNLTAVQLSYGIRPDLVLTGTLGWARSRTNGVEGNPKTDILTYDVGAEWRLPRRSADRAVNFKPFAGIGAGARTYNYRTVDVPSAHNLAAYVSGGGELGLGRVRVRLEARDYLTALGSSRSSAGNAWNDVAILAGLRLGLR